MSVNTYLPPSPVLPPFLLITAITNAYPMAVTVSTENSYVPDMLCRFNLPTDYGMQQLAGQTLKISSVSLDNLTLYIDADSSGWDVFITPPPFTTQPATVAPAGIRNAYNFNYEPFHAQNGLQGN